MAIWKKQNKEESKSNDRESTDMDTRDKVSLSDEDMEKVSGGSVDLYSDYVIRR